MRELNRLKAWLYHQRARVRLERARAERQERKEQKEIQRKAEQPILFEY
jgi:hypothetical protein